ncbi:MAG: hypothetical protein ACYDCA_07385 [Candidatus Tyrphobacter sp.]
MITNRGLPIAQRRQLPAWWIGVSGALLLAIVAHWHHPGEVLQGGDNFFGYDPAAELAKSFLAWNHFGPFLGAPWASGTWIPWYLVVTPLVAALGAGWAQLVVIWLMLFLAWLGTYGFSRALGVSAIGAVAAAWLYILNPWQQLFTGFNYPLNAAVALAPWLALLALRAAQCETAGAKTRVRVLVCIVATAIVPITAANPALVVVDAFAYLFGAGLGLMSIRPGQRWRYLRWQSVTAGYAILASLWWSFLVVNMFAGLPIDAVLSPKAWSFVIGRSSLLNNLRLNAVWGWVHPEYYWYAASYDRNILEYCGGFTAIALSAVALYFADGARLATVRWCLITALAALFLSKGLHPPLAAVNALLYHIPLSAMFREPTDKAPVVALIALSPLVGFAVDFLRERSSGLVRRARRLLYIAAAVGTIASAWPMMTGAQFHGYTPSYHSGSVGLPPQFVALPPYWQDVGRYLNARRASGGVFVVPADPYYQVHYKWGFYGADYLPNWLLQRRVFIPGLAGYTASDATTAIGSAIEAMFRQHSPLALRMLRAVGVRYVLYRGDVHLQSAPAVGNVTAADVATVAQGIRPRSFGPLSLYDIGTPEPEITVSSVVDAGNYSNMTAGAMLGLRMLDEDVPRIPAASWRPSFALLPRYVERNISENLDIEEFARPQFYQSKTRYIGTGSFGDQVVAVGSSAPLDAKALFGEVDSPQTLPIMVSATALAWPRIGRRLLLDPVNAEFFTPESAWWQFANPYAQPITIARVALTVPPGAPTQWTLATRSSIRRAVLGASTRPRWATFGDVALPPGVTDVFLQGYRDSPALESMRASATSFAVGVMRIDPVRPRTTGPQGCALPRSPCMLRALGTITLGIPFWTMPTVGLLWDHASSSQIMAVIHLSVPPRTVDCATVISPREAFDVFAAATRCLDFSGTPFAVRQAVVNGIDFLAEGGSTIDKLAGAEVNERGVAMTPGAQFGAPLAEQNGVPFTVVGAGGHYTILPSENGGADVSRTTAPGATVLVTLKNGSLMRGQLVRASSAFLNLRDAKGSVWEIPVSQIVTVIWLMAPLDVHIPLWTPGDVPQAFTVTVRAQYVSGGRFELRRGQTTVASATFRESLDRTLAIATIRMRSSGASLDSVDLQLRTSNVGAAPALTQVDVNTIPLNGYGGVLIHAGWGQITLRHQRSANDAATLRASPLLRINSSDPSLSVFSVGPGSCSCASNATPQVVGGGPVFLVTTQVGPGVLATTWPFTREWIALGIRPLGLPDEINLDGWRTGWYIDGPGTVLLVNLADVLEFSLMALAVLTIGMILWKKRRSAR